MTTVWTARCSVLVMIFSVLGLAFSVSRPVSGQTPAIKAGLVELPGSVSSRVRAGVDQGAVATDEASGRILLLMERPATKEAALQEYLRTVNTPGSANYHQWLKPEEIGERFGPEKGDLATVESWLQANGLKVSHHSKSRMLLEFSGTVGALNQSFHTEMHQYLLDGAVHRANATALQIPAKFASVIAGVSPLNDFRAQSYLKKAGQARYDAVSRKLVPELTGADSLGPLYTVTPADFATQYDLGPLTTAGVSGSGVTVGIINTSNLDLSLASAFRSNFGVAAGTVQVVIDGDDPGVNDAEVEAALDVERVSGTAPGAVVNLYIATSYGEQDPLLLAAERAIDDDQADVLSVSYGEDEQFLGTSGNALWNSLWEQAAAQGQTVLVATGDTGSSGEFGELSVSGLASTPWNIAVGGTDFYYADWAQGASSAASDWSATNDPVTKGSLKAPVTEQVWNDINGMDSLANFQLYEYYYGGGGGLSACVQVSTANGACLSGYVRPVWQSGTGTRELPDVSLFAANGFNFSSYAVCAVEGDCVPDSNGNFTVSLVGGTSASTPSMAGILALVVQKYGRQGQADPTLYALAQQHPTAFHDITLGNNQTYAFGLTGIQYAAGVGYDLASGLGTVDAANLVNAWGSVTYASTTTSLSASSTSVVHGQPVTLTTSVVGSGGSGTPTGAVGLVSSLLTAGTTGVGTIPLTGSGTGSATLSTLPGGTYTLTGKYSGDASFGPSSSTPVSLTVSAEPSSVSLASVGTFTYGGPAYLSAQVLNAAGKSDGVATGGVAFTVDGVTGNSALNASGLATYQPLFSVGNHTATANYSGDASYKASASTALPFTVAKGSALIGVDYTVPSNGFLPTIPVGGSLSIGLTASPFSNESPNGTLAPTGTLTVGLIGNALDCGEPNIPMYNTQTVSLTPVGGEYSRYSTASTVLTNLAAGYYSVCAAYSGDANWATGGTAVVNELIVSGSPAAPTSLALSITPNTIAGTQLATVTPTLTASPNGPMPTGEIDFYDNGAFLTYESLGNGGPANTYAFVLGVGSLLSNGVNQITAIYGGDGNYAGSTSNVVKLTIAQPADFTLTATTSSLALTGGASGSVGVTLASVGNLAGTAVLACTTSSPAVTCSAAPGSVKLPGPASAVVTVSSTAQAGLRVLPGAGGWQGLAGGAVLACLVGWRLPRRRWRGLAMMVAGTFVLGGLGCGKGGTPVNSVTTVAAYTVTVTATASGVQHATAVRVVVTSH